MRKLLARLPQTLLARHGIPIMPLAIRIKHLPVSAYFQLSTLLEVNILALVLRSLSIPGMKRAGTAVIYIRRGSPCGHVAVLIKGRWGTVRKGKVETVVIVAEEIRGRYGGRESG